MLLVASSFRVGTLWHSSVSDNNNFSAEQTPGSGYGYRAYGELSNFVLHPTEDQDERVASLGGEMGRLHAAKPLFLRCHC